MSRGIAVSATEKQRVWKECVRAGFGLQNIHKTAEELKMSSAMIDEDSGLHYEMRRAFANCIKTGNGCLRVVANHDDAGVTLSIGTQEDLQQALNKVDVIISKENYFWTGNAMSKDSSDVTMRMQIVAAMEASFALNVHIKSLEALLVNESGEVNVEHFTKSLAAARAAKKSIDEVLG